jgi:hypothetical protein
MDNVKINSSVEWKGKTMGVGDLVPKIVTLKGRVVEYEYEPKYYVLDFNQFELSVPEEDIDKYLTTASTS